MEDQPTLTSRYGVDSGTLKNKQNLRIVITSTHKRLRIM